MQYIAGVDQTVGLASCNGNERLYRRLLLKLASKQMDFVDRCRSLIAAGRFVDAIRQAHDLRANCASLGALEIAQLASALEGAITPGSALPVATNYLDDLDGLLPPLLARIQAQIQPEGP